VIFISCTECGFTVRVFGSDDAEMENLVGPGSDWYPDKFPCPKCEGSAAITSIEGKMLPNLKVIDLNPQEAFVAFSGGGLPPEWDCTVTSVQNVLVNSTIESVSLRPIAGTKRCCLDSITLRGGMRVYLASSVHGAAVYRIAGPHSYTKEAVGE